MNYDVDDNGQYIPQVLAHSLQDDPEVKQDPHYIHKFNNPALTSSLGSPNFSAPLISKHGSFVQGNGASSTNRNIYGTFWDYTSNFGTALAYTPTALDESEQHFSRDYNDIKIVETPTPTQTRPSSPLQMNRFTQVKRIFSNLARSRQHYSYAQSHSGATTKSNDMEPLKIQPQGRTQVNTSYLPESRCSGSDALATPPLTPDSLNSHGPLSPAFSPISQDSRYDFHPEWVDTDKTVDKNNIYDGDDGATDYIPSRSPEIQQGKKPERSVCYDTLIEDIPGIPGRVPINPTGTRNNSQVPITDDQEEWYGLEYTLELSIRERRLSDTQSFSAGEHSKSRESWAAIHRGTIHPFLEDEDYYQWKSWHRYLDRQDERKKHRKGLEFKALSKDIAWYYADEMLTRDVMYWQKEVYGVVSEDVKERLAILAERRPVMILTILRRNTILVGTSSDLALLGAFASFRNYYNGTPSGALDFDNANLDSLDIGLYTLDDE